MTAKTKVAAWMKVYPDDFKGGIDEMSTAEVGAYWLLLLHGWDNDGIPASTDRLARVARMSLTEFETAWRGVLAKKFHAHPGDPNRLVNAKQEKVRAGQEAAVKKARAGGRKRQGSMTPEERSDLGRQAANDRWCERDASPNASPSGSPNGSANGSPMPAQCKGTQDSGAPGLRGSRALGLR